MDSDWLEGVVRRKKCRTTVADDRADRPVDRVNRLNAVEYATLEWVDWFNHRRLLEPIGYLPPAELERAYHRQREGSAIAA